MADIVLKEFIKRKNICRESFDEYYNERVGRLEEKSEKKTIGIGTDNNIYSSYVGYNTLIKSGINLVDYNQAVACIQYDGDERIRNLIYNNIIDSDSYELVMVIPIFQTILFDSINSYDNSNKRDEILNLNFRNGENTKYSEIVKKGLSKCLEIAVLTHNVFQILGSHSDILFGLVEKDGKLSTHSFNIVKLSGVNNYMLADFTDMKFFDYDGKNQYGIPLIIISQDEYDRLLFGDKMSFDMSYFMNNFLKANLKPRYDSYSISVSVDDRKRLIEDILQNISSKKI